MKNDRSRKVNNDRRNIGMTIAIIAGLVIGLFIKRLSLGLLIGVVMGLLVGGMWSTKK